ncbi:DNA glycosylase [Xylaria cf. heliscus]|nr:DNA glycosylase [Xylaria cf. heliscus]
MSEEAGEQDAITTEPSISKEPSFHGRLQLKDFMFNGTSHSSSGTRRSPRLQKSQTPTSAASSSESTTLAPGTPAEAAPPTPRRSTAPPQKKKRKTQTRAPGPSVQTTPSAEASTSSSPSPRNKKKKKRVRASSSYAPPSTYAHLPPLTDVIAPNLLILFIGLNPGVQTARTGHAYAHPSNLFWKLLYSSGITPVPCRAEEDRTIAARFSLGSTNIVARPSRNGAELSKAEMDAGVAVLEEKCRRWRPEAVCVVGKSIWESIFRVWKGRNLAKGEFEYGWQTERMGATPPAPDSAAVRVAAGGWGGLVAAQALVGDGAGVGDGSEVTDRGREEGEEEEEERGEKVDDGPWEGARIFVATSTSGLAASLRPEEKERIWKVLGDWCVQRRKERAEEKTMIDA